MKKITILVLSILLLTQVFAAENNSGNNSDQVTIQNMNATSEVLISPVPVLYQNGSLNQEQIREQIQTAVQSMNQTQMQINKTTIQVDNGQVSIDLTQEQNTNRIRISAQNVEIEGVSVTGSQNSSPFLINARVGETNMNVVKEQNKLMIQQEGTQVNVSVNLNNQLMFEESKMYMNVSGQEIEIKEPLQAMNAAMVKNQSRVQVELLVSENMPQYRIMEEKTVRIFGLFPVDMSVSTTINAQNGNVENTNKPWWSFLSIE